MSTKKERKPYYAWNKQSMKLAMECVRSKSAGLNEASRMYGVPKATLKRRLDGKNKKAVEETQIIGSESDLPALLETELFNYIVEMESSLYGVTIQDVQELAYELAERNNIKHRFNKTKKCAGKKWYYAFMRRHPQLSLRQPRATSMSRATGFNKNTVNDFFSKLETIMNQHDLYDAQRIFNMDETGLSTVQKKPRKILAPKGKRQVGAITSGERGATTTAVCCASAAGFFVPPLIIFKRKLARDELRDGAPPGTIFAFNPESAYINKNIFFLWLQHFVETVKPTAEKKVLLILDGHASHTKNLEAIIYAKSHNVILLSLPAHTTHKLQPLDVSFFKPLSLYYIDETEKWLRQNPGRVVTTFQVSMLFGKAYSRAASVGTAANGFAKTGIYPLNKNVFADYEFITTEEELNENIQPYNEIDPLSEISTGMPQLEPPVAVSEPKQQEVQLVTAVDVFKDNFQENLVSAIEENLITKNNEDTTVMDPKTPIKAIRDESNEAPSTKRKNLDEAYEFHIDQISPGSNIARQLRQRSRKAQSSIELTSSPYKTNLEEVQSKVKKPKIQRITSRSAKPEPSTSKAVKDAINIEKWFCKLCLQCEVEDMIKCQICKAWVHTHCACVNKQVKKFVCPLCKS